MTRALTAGENKISPLIFTGGARSIECFDRQFRFLYSVTWSDTDSLHGELA